MKLDERGGIEGGWHEPGGLVLIVGGDLEIRHGSDELKTCEDHLGFDRPRISF